MLLCVASIFVYFSNVHVSDASTLYDRSVEKFQAKVRKTSPKDFTFVVLGDSRDNDKVFKKSLRLAAQFNPLFILHTGDISFNNSSEDLDNFLEILQQDVPDIPFFVVPGNHETNYNINLFMQRIGPLNYVLDSFKLNLRVIVINNSNYSLNSYRLDYLRKQLESKRAFTFVAMHIPPKTKRWRWHTFSDGAAELIKILSDNKISLAFFGHIHQFDEDEIKGIKYIITGGAGASLNRFLFPGDPVYHIVVVTIKNENVVYRKLKIQD